MSDFKFDRESIIWAAGLFEGEGCISLHKAKFSTAPTIQLTTTDKDVIERFHKATAGLGRLQKPRNPNRIAKDGLPYKVSYTWNTYRFEGVQAIIAAFWPWLGERRKARITEVMMLETTREKGYSVHAAKTHCPKGHPYTGDNLVIDSNNGGRRCKICTQEKLKNWKEKNPYTPEQLHEERRRWVKCPFCKRLFRLPELKQGKCKCGINFTYFRRNIDKVRHIPRHYNKHTMDYTSDEQ